MAAKDAGTPIPSTPFATLVGDDVRQFILAHNLDDSSRTKLEALPLEQQVDVVSQDAANVRNMSAVVISRVGRCQREGSQFAGPASQEYVANIVAKYIDMMGLDEKSATGLKALAAKDQVAVMAKDMEGVTNPSGVVDSRVRKLQRGGPARGMGGMGGMGGVGGMGGMGPVGGGRVAPVSMAASPMSMGGPIDVCQYLEEAYRTFVSQYNIDQRAQDQVAQLSPVEKLEVISQGMDNVYNPSGAVASRCSKVRERPAVLGPRAVQWVHEVVGLFCSSYGIDGTSDAYKLLQGLPADKQFEVCSQSLAGARNPQSVLYCRIQKLGPVAVAAPQVGAMVQHSAPAPAFFARSGGASEDVEQFIQRYRLDDRAAGVLRDLAASDPKGAEEVMLQPITPEVRNPSGVIHARVCQRTGASKKAFGMGTGGRAAPY